MFTQNIVCFCSLCTTGVVRLHINNWLEVSFCLPHKIHRIGGSYIPPEALERSLKAIRCVFVFCAALRWWFLWIQRIYSGWLMSQTLPHAAAIREREDTLESASSGLLARNGATHQNLLSCEKPAAARAGC